MSATRKTPSKKELSRPFAPATLAKARRIAATYQIVIRAEDGEYYGRGLEIPGAQDDGRTPDECVTNTRNALTAVVATMLERGETPPPPASAKRTVQVNVRMTAEEKSRLETLARERGFGAVSDYIRSAALADHT